MALLVVGQNGWIDDDGHALHTTIEASEYCVP